MSLARTTIGISRFFERLIVGTPGRRGVAASLLFVTSTLLIVLGLLVIFESPLNTILAVVGLLFMMGAFTVMIVRHEWLFLFGVMAGHSILYGRFPRELGMRVKDSVGPGDMLFFLALVAAIVYWLGHRERPRLHWTLFWPPIILFAYAGTYMLIAFFMWGRQDIALTQAVGLLYFVLAAPTYLCLASGRVWKPFFAILFLTLMAGAVLSMFIETGVFSGIINLTAYGGIGSRSFGDATVRTNQLGMAVVWTMAAAVIVGFAHRPLWKVLGMAGGLSGLLIMFLDRGRVTYAGLLVGMAIVLASMPWRERALVLFRAGLAVAVGVVLIQIVGGPAQDRFNRAVELAWSRVELSRPEALRIDDGIVYRMRMMRQASAVFNSSPMFGAGPGVRFAQAFDFQTSESVPIAHVDNSWIYPLAVVGIVGLTLILFCYASFLGVSIWCYVRLRNPLHKSLAMVPVGMIAWLLVASPFNWWMIDRYHVSALAFAVGMATALVYHERVNGSDVPIVHL